MLLEGQVGIGLQFSNLHLRCRLRCLPEDKFGTNCEELQTMRKLKMKLTKRKMGIIFSLN